MKFNIEGQVNYFNSNFISLKNLPLFSFVKYKRKNFIILLLSPYSLLLYLSTDFGLGRFKKIPILTLKRSLDPNHLLGDDIWNLEIRVRPTEGLMIQKDLISFVKEKQNGL